MKRCIGFLLRRPVAVIAVIALITLFLGLGLPKLAFDSSLDVMMPKIDPSYLLNEEIKKTYGNNGKFIIICVSTDDALRYDFLQRIDDLHADIQEYERYDEELNNRRIATIAGLYKKAGAGPVPVSDFLGSFQGDAPFLRFIRRSLPAMDTSHAVTRGDIARLRGAARATEAIKRDRAIDLIVSPYTMKYLIGEKDSIKSDFLIMRDSQGKRIIPKTVDELARFRHLLLSNPAYKNGIYASDDSGRITDFGIMVRLADKKNHDALAGELSAIIAGYPDLRCSMHGFPVLYREINQYMKQDLLAFVPLVLAVMLVVLWINFRTARGVLLPFLTMIISDIWVLGLMGHLGYRLTVIGIALPPLMIAVGSSYSIHILNRYYIDIDEIASRGAIEGLTLSVNRIALTVILAGLTTVIGFASNVMNSVSAISEWGVFSGIGVLFAVLLAFTLIPPLIALLPHKRPKHLFVLDMQATDIDADNAINRLIRSAVITSTRHYRAVLAATVVVLAASIIGASGMITETSISAYFKKGDSILKSSDIVSRKFGGSSGLNVLVDTGAKGMVKDPAFLKTIEDIRGWLVSPQNADLHIGRTDSFGDFIKTMHMAMNNNDPRFFAIPEKKIDVESYLAIYSGSDDNDDGRFDDFEPYIDRDYRYLNMVARIHERENRLVSSSMMAASIDRIERHLAKTLPAGMSFKTGGEPKIIVRLADYVVSGQIESLVFSLVIVGFIVVLLLKNWWAGIISLVPISTAVVLNFGIMGWLGIRLDIATAIISSITIGIGVDNTIHFLNFYRYFRASSDSIDETISKTLATTGRAILFTAMALVFGFFVFALSSFKPLIYFGLLTAITIVSSTLGSLLLLPSVIKLLRLELAPSKFGSVIWKTIDMDRYFKIE